jgi:hypothetical protein
MAPPTPKEKTKHAYSKDLLLQDLQSDNSFFDNLVDTIPAKLYVPGNSGDDFNPKYFKGQAKESKEARRAKAKQAKREKLDPDLAETTTTTKKRLEGNRPLMPTNSTPPASSASASSVLVVVAESETPAASAATETTTTTTTTTTKDVEEDVDLNPNKSRIEALREKLQAKIAEKRGQRPTDPNTVSKRAARRTEKKKRLEEALKRKKRTTSHAEQDNAKRLKAMDTNHNNDPAQDLAQLDFGRLAGLNSMSPDQYFKANKSLANMSKTKNLQKMLADAQAKKQRLEELAQSSNPDDKTKAANLQWGSAIKEASGERVKDDPSKIKKALKRQVAKKSKSAKAWKSRMDQTQQKKDDRQKIRNHNLNKRMEGGSQGANLSSKRIAPEEDKTAPKKRLSRAGFEGRKQGFLNKKNEQ